MKRKALLKLSLLCMLLFGTMAAMNAQAGAAVYGNLLYTVTDGEAAITDCNAAASGALEIPASINGYPVTAIADEAFYDCYELTSITIPGSVTSVGGSAFYGCTGLTSVTIPGSVTSIGKSAFYNCNGLRSVAIGNNVTSIGDSAFYGCTGLQSVTIGSSVTSIGDSAFFGCSRLTSVTIPDSVTYIGKSAFENCRGLTAVYITDLAAWCGIRFGSQFATPLNYAHKLYINNELATDITIPDSVTYIGAYAFFSCHDLTSVTIGNNVTAISGGAFSHCTRLKSVTIPDSVTAMGTAFDGCTGLTSITIPCSVTYIAKAAFYGCSRLTRINAPAVLKSSESDWKQNCPAAVSYYYTVTYMLNGEVYQKDYVRDGAWATLPEPPEGYSYSFTVNGEPWDGTSITDNVTVDVTATALKRSGAEITGASAGSSSLKYISTVSIGENDAVTAFGTTFIPLWLFNDTSAETANVRYDNSKYDIQDGMTFGATLSGIPAQYKNLDIVGKSYLELSDGSYVWSAAKYTSINGGSLKNVEE